MSVIKARRSLRGVYLRHNKNTNDCATVSMPLPEVVKIPMLQHMGKPCRPLVNKGDLVTVGQKIGDSEELFSVPIHASVSGEVIGIEDYTAVGGAVTQAVVIRPDGKQTVCDTVTPPKVTDRESFLAAVRESGLAGLGGAGFPAHIKLGYQDVDKLDTLVINAAECEPYITSDYRECLESADDIIDGIKAVQKWLNIENAYIGIEDNKPKAIRLLAEKCQNTPNIKVVSLKSKYPQGAEKVIIYAATGRVVNDGQLPADCGVIVMNVSSVAFLARYLKTGEPLVTRRVTVDGPAVRSPKNLRVPLGTPIQEILRFCDTDEDKVKMILMGGPMMGVCVYDPQTPVIKNNNAVLALDEKAAKVPKTTACIRCGKCAYVCPVGLMPAALEKAYDSKSAETLEAMSVNLCINCGCCSYICPAKRNLAQKNQLAKAYVKKAKQPEQN